MLLPRPNLPATLAQVLRRGAAGRCPRCGEGRLFSGWLKPVARCPHCFLDLSRQRADDFPAYIAILVTGHVTAPVLVPLALMPGVAMFTAIATSFTVAAGVMAATLRPAKGGVIAFQWWQGMHGVVRERPEPTP